jgi:sugar O-acyltransferase (sialic acid O-acetyltransferase NeuD family)
VQLYHMNSKTLKKVILVGYSGHAIVVAEALSLSGHHIIGYIEKQKSESSLLQLDYLGFEHDDGLLKSIQGISVFVAIGDNQIREKVCMHFEEQKFAFVTAIHPKANVSPHCTIGSGTLVCQGVNINPLVAIGKGVIINTGAIIEHECIIDNFAHIAPGAVLAGKVKVGKGSFIGANAVVKQGVVIGDYVTIGAGTVVLKNIASNSMVVGNPAKPIKK